MRECYPHEKKLKTLVISSLLLLVASQASALEKAEDYLLKGSQQVQKKNYQEAIGNFQQAIKLDPKNSKAHLLLGLTYANTGDFDQAVKYSQNSITIEPTFAAYHNLGLIYANKGEYEKAQRAYEKALELNPSSYRAWYELALIHAGNDAGSGHFNEAIISYKKVIEMNPQFADAYLGLGAAFYWSGDKGSAEEMVRRLTSLKMKAKAAELQNWIDDKESRKKEPA